MPAQKRLLPDDEPPPPPSPPPRPAPDHDEEEGGVGGEQNRDQQQEEEEEEVELLEQEEDDSEVEDGGAGSSEKDEFILVKLADIRKEVQCPICLGIIRKTRTVMECLHRFCRECIDKSMRLGNNECPACRTHCASRRSLRDDPNYDALIAALYPDIDKYEEEELAFHEEEKNRNKKIQASIAETFRRQSNALGRKKPTAKATAAAFVRRSQHRRSHARRRSSAHDISLAESEDEEEEEDVNGNASKESSSADEPSADKRQKRRSISGNADIDGEENVDEETRRGNRGTSPLIIGNGEMLAWGKAGIRSQGGIRSQTRAANGRFIKGGRIPKLVEYVRNLDENNNELDVHLTLLPLDPQSVHNIERPYICCRPTLCIRHLCQYIALQASVNVEEIEIFARKPEGGSLDFKPSTPVVKSDRLLQVVGAQQSLGALRDSSTDDRGELVLVYRLKDAKLGEHTA